MKSELWTLDKLKNWEKNPRSIDKKDFERLKKQIKKHGVYKPLIITPDGEILGGNMRFRAIKELNYPEAWVSIVEPKSEAEKVEIALSDNDRAGYYDEDALAELVYSFKDQLDIEDYRVDLGKMTGLDDLLSNYAPDNENDDEVSPLPEEAISKLGDLYQLGEHRLLCGDSTKKEDVERLMDGKKADMVFTDPPYGVSYADKNKFLNTISKGNRIQDEIKNDHKDLEDLAETVIYPVFCRIKEVLASKSSYYITAPQGGELLFMMMEMMIRAALPLRHMLIWVKNNHVLGRTDYNYQHEPILYGWDKSHNFYKDGQFTKSIWEINKPHKSDLHPTMKPVALIINALQNSTQQDDIVIDFFGGSGSTLIAAEKLTRKCYMMELDPKYCDVIVKRWEDFTGKEAQIERPA